MQRTARMAQSVWQAYTSQRRMYSLGGVSAPSSKSLWDIMRREHLEPHDARHIHDIWMQGHADPLKHRVASVLTGAQFAVFQENASRSPMFVLPIFKGPNAFESIVVQCQLPIVLVTSLEEYKRGGSFAMPYMTVTHYTELLPTKDVVLVRGDIINPQNLSQFEGTTLLRLMKEFYTDPAKHKFVHTFNHDQKLFDFKRMLDSLGHDTSDLPR